MSSPPDGEITRLLNRAASGGTAERERLAELIYADLRRIASHIMSSERKDHTLQPTVLATEAYMRLVDHENWQSRAHFFAVAAQAIRRILIDYGRRRRTQKRGGVLQRVDLEQAGELAIDPAGELLELDEALRKLETIDPRQSRIVELRYFGGLTDEETAHVLDISVRTVKREWAVARAWLYAELNR